MSFTLVRRSLPPTDAEDRVSYPLEVECTAGDQTSIFVYHRREHPEGGEPVDSFSCIATPLQLRTLPEDEPGEEDGQLIPFYRKSLMRILCTSETGMLEAWADIQRMVAGLAADLAAESELMDQETVVIP